MKTGGRTGLRFSQAGHRDIADIMICPCVLWRTLPTPPPKYPVWVLFLCRTAGSLFKLALKKKKAVLVRADVRHRLVAVPVSCCSPFSPHGVSVVTVYDPSTSAAHLTTPVLRRMSGCKKVVTGYFNWCTDTFVLMQSWFPMTTSDLWGYYDFCLFNSKLRIII